MSRATLYCGDAVAVLQTLPADSVQCVVTSPPYWGLRDYGVPGQLGVEQTPGAYVAALVAVLSEARRVLRPDGTLWLNLGDSHQNAKGQAHGIDPKQSARRHGLRPQDVSIPGLKPKDLVGIPWMVAFALREAGWWLRSDIIWAKPSTMPESVEDRPTRAHEYVFLLTKSRRYFYDSPAIAEPAEYGDHARNGTPNYESKAPGQPTQAGITRRRRSVKRGGFNGKTEALPGRNAFRAFTETRNARTVWTINPQPYSGAHFAAFPEELARRCILAGSRPGDTVLDPFGGSGTVAQVATGNGRDSIYIDLNPKYLELAKQRIGPMLCEVA